MQQTEAEGKKAIGITNVSARADTSAEGLGLTAVGRAGETLDVERGAVFWVVPNVVASVGRILLEVAELTDVVDGADATWPNQSQNPAVRNS